MKQQVPTHTEEIANPRRSYRVRNEHHARLSYLLRTAHIANDVMTTGHNRLINTNFTGCQRFRRSSTPPGMTLRPSVECVARRGRYRPLRAVLNDGRRVMQEGVELPTRSADIR